MIEKLKAFEEAVRAVFEAGKIKAPVHLCGGNESQLVNIFKDIKPKDWVFSTHRSHLHALLHGVDRDWLMKEILEGRSISINCPERRFFCSAIVGGVLPIALGVAFANKLKGNGDHVWVFVGDMAAMTGVFSETTRYASGHNLGITFVIEDNGKSVNTNTIEVWGESKLDSHLISYKYSNTYPHQGSGKWVQFG